MFIKIMSVKQVIQNILVLRKERVMIKRNELNSFKLWLSMDEPGGVNNGSKRLTGLTFQTGYRAEEPTRTKAW